jgi:hypothetical protein
LVKLRDIRFDRDVIDRRIDSTTLNVAGAHQGKELMGRRIWFNVGPNDGTSQIYTAAESALDNSAERRIRETALTRGWIAMIDVAMIREPPYKM